MSFEFREIPVYKLAKEFHTDVKNVLMCQRSDRIISDQLKRASLSIVLNIAEGYGRFHPKDKRNFYVNARASINECIACLDVIFSSTIPTEHLVKAEELGKMLSGLIKRFST